MKYDMSGGAAVIGAMRAIGKFVPKINVIGIVPASENLPGPDATKPGDIHRAMNGKTIEIINTDAEGRLISQTVCRTHDAAWRNAPYRCATLTGACVIALGNLSRSVQQRRRFRRLVHAGANGSGEVTGVCRSTTTILPQ